jgi:hypothetical protein
MAVIARGTKIKSSDPPLTTVRTAYATTPLLPFFHPPIELARCRPRGPLHLDRWIDFSAVCFSMLVQVEFDPNSASNTVRGWLHVQNSGSSGQGQVELVSYVNANQWFVITAECIPGKSYRWYVNGRLYKQVWLQV